MDITMYIQLTADPLFLDTMLWGEESRYAQTQPYPVVSRYTGSCTQGGQKVSSESNSAYQKTPKTNLFGMIHEA